MKVVVFYIPYRQCCNIMVGFIANSLSIRISYLNKLGIITMYFIGIHPNNWAQKRRRVRVYAQNNARVMPCLTIFLVEFARLDSITPKKDNVVPEFIQIRRSGKKRTWETCQRVPSQSVYDHTSGVKDPEAHGGKWIDPTWTTAPPSIQVRQRHVGRGVSGFDE